MALELKISQKLNQTLVMTPQLQQAIKLLQLGRQEYLEVIENELLENPILEDIHSEEIVEDGMRSEVESYSQEHSSLDSAVSEVERLEQGRQVSDGEATTDNFDDILGGTDPAWQTCFGDHDEAAQWSPVRKFNGSDDELPSLESTLTRPEGLESHLLWQLRVSDIEQEDHSIAMQVIGNLDRNGYLGSTVEELSQTTGKSVEDIERVLKLIQELDPAGVGARDLRECLLIQLEQQGYEDHLVFKVVKDHLPKLEIRRYDLIAKEENVSVEDVYEAVKIIQGLEPRPGRSFVTETPVYITPDVYVRKVGPEYVISLNETDMPRLRLNPQYRELFEQARRTQDPQERDYLQDKIRSAVWLIKSIHQRQQTIYKVTESIVRFQREFLEHGVKALKPLVLRDVAEDVSMHESTISRVTTNKYMHTPQGVFELKFFFSSGLRSGEGEVSSEAVKNRIKQLVGEEDPKRPLSDQAIVAVLRAEGIDIARRTVAKYREMLNILSSSRRKKVF